MSATSPCLLRDDQKLRNTARQYSGSGQCAECCRTVIPGDTRMSSRGPPSTIARFTPFLKTCNLVGRGHCLLTPCLFRSTRLGVGRRGSPRFVPISLFSSDLFRFACLVFGNTPICSDLFRFTPFFSDLFRFVFRTYQNKSEKPLSAGKSPINAPA